MKISGKIHDYDGLPLPGSNIQVLTAGGKPKSGYGTASLSDGTFSLEVAPSEFLRVSFLGYSTAEIPVGMLKPSGNIITLSESTELVPEVTVTARKKSWWVLPALASFALLGTVKFNESKLHNK